MKYRFFEKTYENGYIPNEYILPYEFVIYDRDLQLKLFDLSKNDKSFVGPKFRTEPLENILKFFKLIGRNGKEYFYWCNHHRNVQTLYISFKNKDDALKFKIGFL